MAQRNLHVAKQQKNDEFYTQLSDIANELRHYRDQLKDKVILCNCDDPFESNFFKYFAANFNTLGIKKLITTGYTKSPITGSQLSLLDIEGLKPEGEEPYVVEINEVPDLNHDGAISLDDVEHLLKHDKNVATPLKGDSVYPAGDFRSAECIELLKKSDIVVTNPPFSLFREFVAQLVEHEKQFLIIGSKNAITYKETFKLIKDNKLWLGYGFSGGNAFFKIPPEKAREFASGVYDPNTGLVKFRNVGWFTNLFVDKSEDPITPYLTYEQGLARGLYPKYDNYDAIEVSKIADIPSDYDGVMGVPITFLDRWVPDVAALSRERERERVGKSSDSTGTSRATDYRIDGCSSTTGRSTHDFSSSGFRVVGSNRGVDQDDSGYYGRSTYINGKETFKRLFIQ